MKTRILYLGAGVLAGIGLLATGCHKAGGPSGFKMPPPLVTVAEVVAKDAPVYLDEIGQGTAFEAVTVTPQVSGVIMERKVEDGADVKKGQLLFTIDPRPFQAQLDSAKAQLVAAKAALELAKGQLAMYASVNDVRAVSKFDYDTKVNTVEVDKAQIEAAQATVEIAQLNLEYCQVHSPIDGRTGRRLVDIGNVVTANQTPLLSIQRLDPIYADFTITERDLPNVQEELSKGALQALVRLPSDRESDAIAGELTFLDNSVQSASGTVNLRATIANAYRHFWPGQFMRVRLVLATKKNSLLVPSQATQISQQGPFVYVVKADNTADLRQVTLGQRQGDLVVIEKGVAPGERVVVTGQMSVNPGGEVRVDKGPARGTNSVSTTGATP